MPAPPRTTHEEVRDVVIGLGGDTTVRQLATEMGLHTTTARHYLDDLFQEGWAIRESSPRGFVYSILMSSQDKSW